VLFIAGSTGIGMANSILDNVNNVNEWYQQAIVGDYFIRAMMPDMATGTAADLPDGLAEDLEKVDKSKIASIEGVAFVEGQVPVPAQAGEEEPPPPFKVIVIARKFVDETPPFDLESGDLSKIRDQLKAGQVVIGSVLAQKQHLKLGDKLKLETREGVKELPICAVANEYMVGGLAVHMHRDLAIKLMGVEGYDGFIIRAKEGQREALKPELEKIARKYDVFLLLQGDIRDNIDRIVGGVQWSLWVLVLLGFVVAAFGVVNTLTMNVLEQTRELGLLRIVAMTKDQVRRTIVTQALIIGGIGLPPGIAMGVAIAYVLNQAMVPSIGHAIDFQMHPTLLVSTLVGALVIVLIAAIIPAIRATRINVVEALHYE
jgi:putative ABC transport system permease protein